MGWDERFLGNKWERQKEPMTTEVQCKKKKDYEPICIPKHPKNLYQMGGSMDALNLRNQDENGNNCRRMK